MSEETKTPISDSITKNRIGRGDLWNEIVPASIARTLEIQLAEARKEREQFGKELHTAQIQLRAHTERIIRLEADLRVYAAGETPLA